MRRMLLLAASLALVSALAPGVAQARSPKGGHDPLERYAAATWHSFVKMVEPRTGLPSDNIGGRLHPHTRSEFTSPTNIGMYLWATLAARDLDLISHHEATGRIRKTLTSLERLERHQPSGQFYN
jgi:hypothetical protein